MIPPEQSLVFIDANKYLDLFRTAKGKQQLASLAEQSKHLFVTEQVANEVDRNKLDVAVDFLRRNLTEIKMNTYAVPDHLFGPNEEESKNILSKMKEIGQEISKINNRITELAKSIIEKIVESRDEVSTMLAPIFANVVPHTEEELIKARNRKELGRPPGKHGGAIGDELAWEQILSHSKDKKAVRIITRDSDYGTFYEGRGFLNKALYDELRKIAPASEVFFLRT